MLPHWSRAAEPLGMSLRGSDSLRSTEPLGAAFRGAWPRTRAEAASRESGAGAGPVAGLRATSCGAASSSRGPAGGGRAFGAEVDTRWQQPISSPRSSAAGVEADCPGPWLRAWVEFQVDARINQALRALAEGELFAADRPPVAAVGDSMEVTLAASEACSAAADAGRLCHHLEGEVRVVAEAQARILSVMDGLAARVAMSENPSRSTLSGEGQTLERLEGRISELREEASQRQHQSSEKLASALDVLAGTQREVGALAQALDRLNCRFSECEGTVAPAAEASVDSPNKAQSSGLYSELGDLRQAQSRLEARLERLDRDVCSVHKGRSALEGRFEELRTDLASAVVTRDEFKLGLEELDRDIADALVATKQELLRSAQDAEASRGNNLSELHMHAFEKRVQEGQQGLMDKVEAWQTLLDKELANQHQRLAAELHTEINSAVQHEYATATALDEQMWLTDQRLGQRIDEVDQRVAAMFRGHLEAELGGAESFALVAPSQREIDVESVVDEAAVDDGVPGARIRARLGAASYARGRHNTRESPETSIGYEVSLSPEAVGALRSLRHEGPPAPREHTPGGVPEEPQLPRASSSPAPGQLLERRPSLFTQIDANKDGVITRAEWKEAKLAGVLGEASTPPIAMERVDKNRGALTVSSARQRLRIGVSGAMATAAQALAGGEDEEERRQLARLARLERVQERAVSPAYPSTTLAAPAEEKANEDFFSRPQADAREESVEGRHPSPGKVPSASADARASSPLRAPGSPVALAERASMTRAARRRGPFSGDNHHSGGALGMAHKAAEAFDELGAGRRA